MVIKRLVNRGGGDGQLNKEGFSMTKNLRKTKQTCLLTNVNIVKYMNTLKNISPKTFLKPISSFNFFESHLMRQIKALFYRFYVT